MATSQTWDTIERKGNPKGLATITFGERKVKIEFVDGSVSKEFSKDALPDLPKFLHKMEAKKKIEAFVVLSSDMSEIQSVRPERGRVKVKCVDFVRNEEGSDPEPKEYQGNEKYAKEGQPNKYLAFNALMEVIEGIWIGVTIPLFLHYKFTDNGRGKAAFVGSEEKSKNLRKLKQFCNQTGVTKVQFDWPEDENILPQMLKQIRKVGAEFEVQVNAGYIETILDGAADVEELPDVDEAFPPIKKASKKSKK